MECRRKDNIVRQLAMSADEIVCAMKQLNEYARKIGPYSEEELQARKRIWKKYNIR